MAGVLANADLRMTVADIEGMLGDTRGTIRRILEGYYLVEQLKEKDSFRPEDSMRKGRGSNPEYPFSWVYNALDYNAIREWLGIKDLPAPKANPLPQSKLSNGAELMVFLFGNEGMKKPAAITDSRQISDLAHCIANEETLAAIRRGMDVQKALKKVQPTASQPERHPAGGRRHAGRCSGKFSVGAEFELSQMRARSSPWLGERGSEACGESTRRVLDAMQG